MREASTLDYEKDTCFLVSVRDTKRREWLDMILWKSQPKIMMGVNRLNMLKYYDYSLFPIKKASAAMGVCSFISSRKTLLNYGRSNGKRFLPP